MIGILKLATGYTINVSHFQTNCTSGSHRDMMLKCLCSIRESDPLTPFLRAITDRQQKNRIKNMLMIQTMSYTRSSSRNLGKSLSIEISTRFQRSLSTFWHYSINKTVFKRFSRGCLIKKWHHRSWSHYSTYFLGWVITSHYSSVKHTFQSSRISHGLHLSSVLTLS